MPLPAVPVHPGLLKVESALSCVRVTTRRVGGVSWFLTDVDFWVFAGLALLVLALCLVLLER